VAKAVEAITTKMSQSKIAELHPPFLPKTITRFRHEYFLPLKKEYHGKLNGNSPSEFKSSILILHSFIARLDCEHFDLYL
jgi:hypothetical protein